MLSANSTDSLQCTYLPGKVRICSKIIQKRNMRQHSLYSGTEKILYLISPFDQKKLAERIAILDHALSFILHRRSACGSWWLKSTTWNLPASWKTQKENKNFSKKKEEKQEQFPTKININKCKASSHKTEKDKSCRRIGYCLCKTQRKHLKLFRRLKGAWGIGAAPWHFITRVLHRKEVKYKYAPAGTTKARNVYECLYTLATNKVSANTEYHLKKKQFIPDKDDDKITELENVHLLLKHLWLTDCAEIWVKKFQECLMLKICYVMLLPLTTWKQQD